MIEVFGITDVGKTREKNEDSFFVKTGLHYFGVCDGMGGHAGGDVASSMVVDVFNAYDILDTDLRQNYVQYVTNPALSLDENNLVNLLLYANDEVYFRSRREPDLEGMGSTAVVCYVRESKDVCLVNVGDSRAYHISDQMIRQITRDHTWVEEHIYSRGLTLKDLKDPSMAHVVTRAVGSDDELDVDFFKEPLKKGYYMLCSDGVTGMISDRDLLKLVLETEGNLECKAQKIVDEANARGGTDNITLVLMHYDGDDN